MESPSLAPDSVGDVGGVFHQLRIGLQIRRVGGLDNLRLMFLCGGLRECLLGRARSSGRLLDFLGRFRFGGRLGGAGNPGRKSVQARQAASRYLRGWVRRRLLCGGLILG
jgi:hypothetical protein